MEDYNDPANPTSVFYQWQLSQQPNGLRESSSTAMLPPDVRVRKNLVIKVRALGSGGGVDVTRLTTVACLRTCV